MLSLKNLGRLCLRPFINDYPFSPEDYCMDHAISVTGQFSEYIETECPHCRGSRCRISLMPFTEGRFACSDCGVTGSNMVAFHMCAYDTGLINAAKNLGIWKPEYWDWMHPMRYLRGVIDDHVPQWDCPHDSMNASNRA